MVDTSNQQFYEYNPEGGGNDGGTSVSRRSLWIGAVALLGFIAVVLITVLIVRVVQNNQNKQVLDDQISAANGVVERELVDCGLSDDPDACKSRSFVNTARDTGLVELCEDVDIEALRSCVSTIAFDKKDPKLCSMLEGDDKTSCEDLASAALAESTLDIKVCKDISDDERRESCEAVVIQNVVSLDDCGSYGVDQNYCDDKNRIKDAATGDPEVCRALAEEDEVNECIDLIVSYDRDGDGLSAYDEFLLGTSDQSMDTDGDGHSDLIEFINNFDPLS